jgi:hypothetical protein
MKRKEQMKFLVFSSTIEVRSVEKFIVSDYYKQGIHLSMSDDFLRWIVNPLKEVTISLSSSLLEKYELVSNADPSKIDFDFEEDQPPVLPATIFLAQLKALLEGVKGVRGLNTGNDGINVFKVSLGDSIVLIYVYEEYGCWMLDAFHNEKQKLKSGECILFTPASAA